MVQTGDWGGTLDAFGEKVERGATSTTCVENFLAGGDVGTSAQLPLHLQIRRGPFNVIEWTAGLTLAFCAC